MSSIESAPATILRRRLASFALINTGANVVLAAATARPARCWPLTSPRWADHSVAVHTDITNPMPVRRLVDQILGGELEELGGTEDLQANGRAQAGMPAAMCRDLWGARRGRHPARIAKLGGVADGARPASRDRMSPAAGTRPRAA
jgi:hypothetical protein